MTLSKPLILVSSAAAILALSGCAQAEYAESTPPQLTEKQQKKLDRKLAGRIAGEPVSCIRQLRGRTDYTAVSDDILIYEVGDTVYVNQPYGGCPGAENNALVTRRTTSQLCSGEPVEVYDTLNDMTYGNCALGKFTPYRKPGTASD